MKWTACKDAMPDKDALYIIHAPSLDENSPFITTAWYNPAVSEWSGLVPVWLEAITHWMPLPDPPIHDEDAE